MSASWRSGWESQGGSAWQEMALAKQKDSWRPIRRLCVFCRGLMQKTRARDQSSALAILMGEGRTRQIPSLSAHPQRLWGQATPRGALRRHRSAGVGPLERGACHGLAEFHLPYPPACTQAISICPKKPMPCRRQKYTRRTGRVGERTVDDLCLCSGIFGCSDLPGSAVHRLFLS